MHDNPIVIEFEKQSDQIKEQFLIDILKRYCGLICMIIRKHSQCCGKEK